MEQFGIAVQEQFTAWSPVLTTIVLSLPGAALGSLISLIITDRLKARYQADLEDSKNEYQRDLARLKLELDRSADSFRAQLGAVSFEHQTRFSRLHERRVLVIDDLYKRLVRTEGAFSRAVMIYRSGSSQEAIEEEQRTDEAAAVDAANDFIAFFRENRIWLEPQLVTDIDRLVEAFRDAWFKYTTPREERGQARDWSEAWRLFNEGVPKIRAEIERTMRAMLDAPTPSHEIREPSPAQAAPQ